MGKFSNEPIATLTFTRQSVNTAPSFSSAQSFEVDENQTAAGTVAAEDSDSGDEVTYAITGGADASKFEIGETTGVVTFKVPPNYESPADIASTDPLNAAGNNEYIVTVTASGGTAGRALTAEQTITVTVGNLEEAGNISFSQVGAAIRAKLSDPDGGVSGRELAMGTVFGPQHGMDGHQRGHLGPLHAVQRRRRNVLASHGVLQRRAWVRQAGAGRQHL